MSALVSLPNELFAITGLFTGLLSGILGIGGAFILVPVLLAIFGAYFVFDPQTILQMTLGTTMACMIVNSVSSTWSHKKLGTVDWSYIKKNGFVIAVGTAVGVVLTSFFAPLLIKLSFALFCIYVGAKVILKKKQGSEITTSGRLKVGLFGTLCGFIGVGGSSIFVNHFVSSEGMDFKKAIGTATALQVPISIIGTVSYILLGITQTNTQSVGFVFIPAFIIISIVSFFSVKIGVAISTKIATNKLKILFGLFTIGIGFNMIFQAVRSLVL